MINRAADAVSFILHGVLIVLVVLAGFEVSPESRRDSGMQIEIVSLEHAMPALDPVLPSAAEDRMPSQPVSPLPTALPQPEPVEISNESLVASVPALSEAVPLPVLGPGSAAPEVTPLAQPSGQPEQVLPSRVASAPREDQARLDVSALASSLGAEQPRRQRARINSAALGSAIGLAAPRGVDGLTVRQRADLARLVRSQVIPCWNPPSFEGAGPASVKLRFHLDRQGNVVGQPVVSGAVGGASPYINLLANSGRRAILLCAPLRLPPELYEAWANVEVEFDPRNLR